MLGDELDGGGLHQLGDGQWGLLLGSVLVNLVVECGRYGHTYTGSGGDVELALLLGFGCADVIAESSRELVEQLGVWVGEVLVVEVLVER